MPQAKAKPLFNFQGPLVFHAHPSADLHFSHGKPAPKSFPTINSGLASWHYFCFVQNILNAQDKEVWDSFVDLAGRSALRLGLARSLGQVYAAIYLSPRPLGLGDLMESLHISKGNASMSVRQLAEWGAIRGVWVKGDRKDYYEATPQFSEVLHHFLSVILKPRILSTENQLKGMHGQLQARNGKLSEEGRFMKERINRLENLHKKLNRFLPLAEKLLR